MPYEKIIFNAKNSGKYFHTMRNFNSLANCFVSDSHFRPLARFINSGCTRIMEAFHDLDSCLASLRSSLAGFFLSFLFFFDFVLKSEIGCAGGAALNKFTLLFIR